MHVPYFDLKRQYRSMREDILQALDGVCARSEFILGSEVRAFEEEFARYCDASHCVALNSGTSALHLALLALGVGAADEVITTTSTFVATVEAVSYTGAKPVLVDIDAGTGCIDPDKVEAAITGRTKAIIAVHLYGRPSDLDRLTEISSRRGVPLVEDACQAHGARWQGRRVGSFGVAAAFSFYPGKNLGAYGEGGALTTNNADVAERARILRDHGQTKRYAHEAVGFNYRMDGFQGAVLRRKLPHLDDWNERRRQIAKRYRQVTAPSVAWPEDSPFAHSVYHLAAVWVKDRDRVRDVLARRGVDTAIHYPIPVHLQAAYADLGYRAESFPCAERAAERAMSLPIFPEMTDQEIEFVATSFEAVVAEL